MKQLIVGTLTAVTMVACGHPEVAERPTHVDVGPTFTVTVESLPAFLPVHGTVQAVRRASLSTRMMARVTAVEIEIGTQVVAGQVLVRLGLDDIEANRAKAEAAVRVATAAFAEAERHAARMDTLFQHDAVARVQRDQAMLQRTQAMSQLAMAEAVLSEVETAEQYATIRAPFSGAVVRRSVNVGDLAAPGMPLVAIDGRGDREAVLSVPADLAAELGTNAVVHVVAPDGREHRAPVRAVAAGADPKTRTMEVRVTLPPDWPTGIAVNALVPSGARHTIVIPANAVVRRGQLTGVWILTDGGPVLRWVRLGRAVPPFKDSEHGAARVEVLSGLEAGERIVL